MIEKIEIGSHIETKFGTFKVVNVMDLIEPFTLQHEKGVFIDWNGEERKIRNEDIIGIVD